jgi:hypothetical protein
MPVAFRHRVIDSIVPARGHPGLDGPSVTSAKIGIGYRGRTNRYDVVSFIDTQTLTDCITQ